MKILVMVDMQNDFLSGALGNPDTLAIVPGVCERVEAALSESYELFYTMDTHGEDYMETQEGRNLPVPHCIKGTDGWELPDELKALLNGIPDDRMIEKVTFGSKELPERIAALGEIPDEIEFMGVCTDICVISNAMLIKAFYPEVKIKVNSRCCAGTSPEAHSRALDAMKMCQIEIF